MKTDWTNKKVLIIGLSKSGTAAAEHLASKGASCFITEIKPLADKDKPLIEKLEKKNIKIETGAHSEEFISNAYIAVTSPGVPPSSGIFKSLKEKNIPVISEIELAYREASAPFIAITGTNGKTTTTMLASHILSSEYNAPACGNIGIPAVSLIEKNPDYYVLEASSFQLAFSPSFRPKIACFLTFTPDHINWHGSLDNYFEAKTSLFKEEKLPDYAVFSGADETIYKFAQNYKGEKYIYAAELEKNCCYIKDGSIYFKREKEEEIIKLDEIKLKGEHNYQNIMCAVTAAKLAGISNFHIKERVMSFEAPPHRIEYAGEIQGKKFYNDSKATNPEASFAAIKAFKGRTVTLIAGGRDKNTDLTEFCRDYVNRYISDVILIGEAEERFKKNMQENGFNNIISAGTLEEAVNISLDLNNEIVLLSPACASFDMFNSYEHRGEVFKNYVKAKIQALRPE